MKVKINPKDLFKQGIGIGKYLSIIYSDVETSDILETYDINEYELEQIIENYLYITLRADILPETIEVDTITYPIKTDDFLNDKAEVLSQKWIDKNSILGQFITNEGLNFDKFVKADKLKKLLVLKQELPVIPEFVADWYENEGKCSNWWNWFYKWGRDESRTELEAKTIKWMQDYNEEKFVDIFRYGYEAEEEQKYFVEDNEFALLCKGESEDGWKVISTHELKKDESPFEILDFELTEQEIKDYDERFWPFAVKVEELE